MANDRFRFFDLTKAIVCFSIGLYFLHATIAVVVSRGLFSDGSNFFIGLLSGDYFWPFWDDQKHIRLGINILNQLPASILVKVGVTNLAFLRFAFSFGLFFTPVLVYFYSAWLSHRAKDWRVFACALISLVAFSIPSEIFILNQAFSAVALCWLLLHYAILDISLRRLDYFAIILAIAVLFRSHESMLLWGLALAFAAWFRVARTGVWVIGVGNLHQHLIACGGLLHAFFVAWWQFSHPVDQQTESYLQLIKYVTPTEMWKGNTRITLILIGSLLLLGSIYFARSLRKSSKQSTVLLRAERLIAFGAVYAVIYGFMLFVEPTRADPFREYQYRFLITLGSTAMMFFTLLLHPVSLEELLSKYRHGIVVVSFCFIGATIWQMINSVHWSTFQRVAVHTLSSTDEVVVSPANVLQRLETTGMKYLYNYSWGWTWPVFGLSLQNSNSVLRVYRPEGFEEYFKLPKSESPDPFFPFVQFRHGGYFNFDMLREACNRGECD